MKVTKPSIPPFVKRISVHAENPMHLVYFFIVFIEAHGLYAMAAGLCCVVGVIAHTVKRDEGDESESKE